MKNPTTRKPHPPVTLFQSLESRLLLSSTFLSGYSFTGASDGGSPTALIVDPSGNVFGTTSIGGSLGSGTYFGIAAGTPITATPTLLANLSPSVSPGASPTLVVDSSGNVFGTSQNGGANSAGAIFEVPVLTRIPQVILSFPALTTLGQSPTLTLDADGNPFGTTLAGGANAAGQIFDLTASGDTFSTFFSFSFGDGALGPIVIDSSGNIFGLTTTGGTNGTGQLYAFLQGQSAPTSLASLPAGVTNPSLTLDSHDNLFGTTQTGGKFDAGTLFEFKNSSQSLRTLYNFPKNSPASFPNAHIVVDASDNIFGTTSNNNTGTAFELDNGQSTPLILQTFANASPTYGLAAGQNGLLYGLTSNGGANSDGSLFSLTITPTPPATQLVFSLPPSSGGDGTLAAFTVTVEDATGALSPTNNSRVTIKIASGPPGAKISGTLSVNAVNGVATFTKASLPAAGTYTLQATSASLTSATSDPFTLNPSAPTHLVFVQQPTTTAAGTALSPSLTVFVEDKFNNLVTTDSSTVTLSLSSKPAGGALANGQLSVTASNGIATFTGLIFDVAGSYTLLASDDSLSSTKSKSFAITADLSTAHLVLLQSPSATAVVGAKLTPFAVILKDQFGNIIKGSKSNAVVSVASGPSGGNVAGAPSASISSDTAKFKNLSLTTAGSYTLQIADPSLLDISNVPLTFLETVTLGITTLSPVKPAKSYKLGKTITLHASLKSTASSSIPYAGAATLTDSLNNILGTVTLSTKGALTATIANLPLGSYTCTLNYSGDPNHTPTLSNAFTLLIQ